MGLSHKSREQYRDAARKSALARGQALWTEDADNMLRAMNAAGATSRTIGEVLGRTKTAVRARKVRLGLTSPGSI